MPQNRVRDPIMHVTLNTSMNLINLGGPTNLLVVVCQFMSFQELNVQRPPTPTRGRPQPANDRGSLAWI